MRNLAFAQESAPVSHGSIGATVSQPVAGQGAVSRQAAGAGNLTRRSFMRRGALLAAGGAALAVPGWARWLGEQMEKLQPKPRVFMPPLKPDPLWMQMVGRTRRQGQIGFVERMWPNLPQDVRDVLDQHLRPEQKAALEQLRQEQKQNPWAGSVTLSAMAYASNIWFFGFKEA